MNAEAVVIGGGLAGAAVATLLARAGRDVMLVEREREPRHKVCGEFLSGEALGSLASLGVDVHALGAVPIESVRFAGGKLTALPFPAMSLTRMRLDEELLRIAAAAGVRVIRGVEVRGMIVADRPRMQLSTGHEIDAGACFLATGKHDLRGWPRPLGQQNRLVAMKMYYRLTPEQTAALNGCVELILYGGGYAGLQPVEDGVVNLCCLIRWRRVPGGWDGLVAHMQKDSPLLRDRLKGAKALLPKALAISHIPYGMMREPVAGVWCLGDQAAVIPSFTGDGMSIALHTAEVATRMYLAGEAPEAYQCFVAEQLQQQVGLATTLSRGMVAAPNLMRAAASLWPGALRVVAERTRVASSAS